MDSSSKKSKQRSERPSSPEDLNPPTIMKERRRKGESFLSCAENKPSTTRQHVRRFESPSSSSSEDKQPSTPRRKQAWIGESPSSSSSEDDEPSTTRQRVRRFESPFSSSSEDKQPSTPRRKQAWIGESPSSSSSEDEPSTPRQRVRRFESPSSSSSEDDQRSTTRQQERKDVSSLFFVGTNMKERRQKENTPSTTRQQEQRAESPSSSFSEDDQRSTTRRQQQQSPLSFVDINLSTTFRQNGGIGESHLPCIDSLIEREFFEREKQRLEEGLKRERERCKNMKRKNQEKERKTFSLRSRLYTWWHIGKVDYTTTDIQVISRYLSYLLRCGKKVNLHFVT
ncbi:proteoglycan 4-like [Sander lucioperca]|uniref:proteoglycan 4-like n=1 Tax=Sander lucioperca TaxID=283035 RepID=UPI001653E7EE|nr:proteoglycan 4-like [Sander lucioperca]